MNNKEILRRYDNIGKLRIGNYILKDNHPYQLKEEDIKKYSNLNSFDTSTLLGINLFLPIYRIDFSEFTKDNDLKLEVKEFISRKFEGCNLQYKSSCISFVLGDKLNLTKPMRIGDFCRITKTGNTYQYHYFTNDKIKIYDVNGNESWVAQSEFIADIIKDERVRQDFVNNGSDEFKDSTHIRHIGCEDDYAEVIYDNKRCVPFKISKVHELQNIYSDLGGKELIIKFRNIEKQ